MTFAHPGFLLLLIAVPILGWAMWRQARRAESALTFSSTGAAASLAPSLWVRMRHAPMALRLGALTLGVLALARPQERDAIVTTEAEGIDIVLVLDLSSSMLAQDFRPNRFEVAKDVAVEFVRGRQHDRIGLVVFAGQAYTQVPLTRDYDFLVNNIRNIGMGQIEDGTAIGTGLATAVARLRDSDAESRVVLLLTDGQNNRGEIDPMTAAEVARALGVRVHAIGMGLRGVDAMGRPLPDHLRALMPDDGVDEASLTALAELTGGLYLHAETRDALSEIYDQLSEMETSIVEEQTFLDVRERYAAFLWPAFLLILMELVLVSTRLLRIP